MAELSLYIFKMFLLWFVCTYCSLKLGMSWEKTETAKYMHELGHSWVRLTNIGPVRSWIFGGVSLLIPLAIMIMVFNGVFGPYTPGMEPAGWFENFFKIPNY